MKKLELISYVAIIIVCAIASVNLIGQRFEKPRPSSAQLERSLVGTRLSLGEIPWSKAKVTLVLAMSSHCVFCAQSLPLYRKLNVLANSAARPFSLVVVCPDATSDISSYLSANAISPARVLHADLRSLGITGTPTLLLVDSSGVVRKVFAGRLADSREQELLHLLSLQSRTSL